MSNVEFEALRCVKELTRQIASSGKISYAEMCEDELLAPHWNKDSLKQFCARKATPRNNIQNNSLGKYILMLVTKDKNLNKNRNYIECVKKIELLFDLDGQYLRESILIDKQYDLINSASQNIDLNNYYAFCRFDVSRKYIIIINVQIIHGDGGKHFIMKIKGSRNNKRIVYGNISHTIVTTYLNGIAFNVSSAMDEENFQNFKFSDLLNEDYVRRSISSNPVGQEIIAIPNHSLADSIFSVGFCGLDGRGDPITGVGYFINSNRFEEFHVNQNKASYIECANNSSPIAQEFLSEKFHTRSVYQG